MKKILPLFVFLSFAFTSAPQWEASQLIESADLYKLISTTSKTPKPIIYNIGSMENIYSAIKMGEPSKEESKKKIKEHIKTISPNRLVVVYCGCCSSDHCPNIKPAYDYIQQLGHSNVKVLNLPTSLAVDWTNKGYPLD
jgi:hypothetical protein